MTAPESALCNQHGIDDQGRCIHHPFIQLRRQSARTGSWLALLDNCPMCPNNASSPGNKDAPATSFGIDQQQQKLVAPYREKSPSKFRRSRTLFSPDPERGGLRRVNNPRSNSSSSRGRRGIAARLSRSFSSDRIRRISRKENNGSGSRGGSDRERYSRSFSSDRVPRTVEEDDADYEKFLEFLSDASKTIAPTPTKEAVDEAKHTVIEACTNLMIVEENVDFDPLPISPPPPQDSNHRSRVFRRGRSSTRRSTASETETENEPDSHHAAVHSLLESRHLKPSNSRLNRDGSLTSPSTTKRSRLISSLRRSARGLSPALSKSMPPSYDGDTGVWNKSTPNTASAVSMSCWEVTSPPATASQAAVSSTGQTFKYRARPTTSPPTATVTRSGGKTFTYDPKPVVSCTTAMPRKSALKKTSLSISDTSSSPPIDELLSSPKSIDDVWAQRAIEVKENNDGLEGCYSQQELSTPKKDSSSEGSPQHTADTFSSSGSRSLDQHSINELAQQLQTISNTIGNAMHQTPSRADNDCHKCIETSATFGELQSQVQEAMKQVEKMNLSLVDLQTQTNLLEKVSSQVVDPDVPSSTTYQGHQQSTEVSAAPSEGAPANAAQAEEGATEATDQANRRGDVGRRSRTRTSSSLSGMMVCGPPDITAAQGKHQAQTKVAPVEVAQAEEGATEAKYQAIYPGKRDRRSRTRTSSSLSGMMGGPVTEVKEQIQESNAVSESQAEERQTTEEVIQDKTEPQNTSQEVNQVEERKSKAEEGDLEKLARALIEQKIQPEVVQEDVISNLKIWLRVMLDGPAQPLNKDKNFMKDILISTDFVADAEIFVESLPGCDRGLIERNRADETKKKIYPDVNSALGVREDVLRNRCIAMVNHFANEKDITDEALKKKASDDFYDFYYKTITKTLPPSYNSYTGVVACMRDMKFLRESEEIVLDSLGFA